MSRSKTNLVANRLAEVAPCLLCNELDVIRLIEVTSMNMIEKINSSIGKFNRIAHKGRINIAINHHTAESFHGVKRTPSAGTIP